jgi:hypothetical protein
MFNALIERLKHLPGRHDQSSHGRPGRVGSAFRGAYSAARAGGATHREAWNQAKTAAEQVRETIRAEKRADLIANPKPKRVMPARVTPPPTTPATPASLRDRSVDEIAAEFERLLDVIPQISPKLAADLARAEVEYEAESKRYVTAKIQYEQAAALFMAKYITEDDVRARKKEYEDARKSVTEKEKEVKKLKRDEVYETVQPLTDGYMKFLDQMRHPNPAQVSITHVGGTPEERARAEKLISATAAMFPNDNNPYGIFLTVNHSLIRGQYDHSTRTIRTDVRPGTIVHEALHAMQYANPDTMLNGVTDSWAIGRTKGEQAQSLQKLDPNFGGGKNEIGYRDAVDNPYTLRSYPRGTVKTNFLEVLTQAFTVSRAAPIRARKDKELLRVGIEAVLRASERWFVPYGY